MSRGNRILSIFLCILYLAVTLVGLFLFRGIPVLNVALGFPIGAAIGARSSPRSPAGTDRLSHSLQAILWWALGTAAITMILCWLELGASMFILRWGGLNSAVTDWIPLLPPPPTSGLVRAQFFAVVVAPLIQVLTTAFGGMIVLLLMRNPRPDPTD